ncbi:MAG: CRISPR system precrRNA processing endoribonuclease RAMP protein Cas6 [Acidobacteria bacterium]|nr:CRISPR system precrRNA processing endoribonuclease RAMP protein Cas6 [Acidobacteriota bacterium]
MAGVFLVRPLRYEFQAVDRVFIPAGKEENVFRGAMGLALKRVCCGPECQGTETCDSEPVCGYRRIFAPKLTDGPSGVSDPPRPFVLRVADRFAGWIEPDGRFEIRVHLFDPAVDPVRYLTVALAQFGSIGLGPSRGRCRLAEPDGARIAAETLPPPLELDLGFGVEPCDRIEVEFVTPTEIKVDGAVVARPEFRMLMARVRDRVSSLMRLYQGAGPEIDYEGFLAEAREVRMVGSELQERAAVRHSSRTGQRHPLGGAVGKVVYEGPVGKYLPWLRAAEWTGVGRQTVWGKGQIAVRLM